MKKKISFILCMLLICLCFVGCDNSQTAIPTTNNTQETTVVTETTVDSTEELTETTENTEKSTDSTEKPNSDDLFDTLVELPLTDDYCIKVAKENITDNIKIDEFQIGDTTYSLNTITLQELENNNIAEAEFGSTSYNNANIKFSGCEYNTSKNIDDIINTSNPIYIETDNNDNIVGVQAHDQESDIIFYGGLKLGMGFDDALHIFKNGYISYHSVSPYLILKNSETTLIAEIHYKEVENIFVIKNSSMASWTK